MTIKKRDGVLCIDLFWDDLSAVTRAELYSVLGDNGNFDVYPLATVDFGPPEEDAPDGEGIRTTIKFERGSDHFVSGNCGRYQFEAKVYDEGSERGINGGRVSKLNIRYLRSGKKTEVVNYDRGWDAKPQSDYEYAVLSAIVCFLEQLPPESELPQKNEEGSR